MRSMFGLVLVAGIGLAGAAVYMAKGYIGQTQSALEQERELRAKIGPIVQVYVAKTPKNYGEPLRAEDVELVYWPKNSLPEGVFMEEAALFPEGEKEDRFVLRTMEKFEPILASKVTEPGEPAGLAGKLGKGMRAFAIKIDDRSGVQSNVRADDRIDIYWTGVADASGLEITQLIVSGATVIATEKTSKDDDAVVRNLTVAATPKDVGLLAQAQATGRLTFSLIGPAGTEGVGSESVTAETCMLTNSCQGPTVVAEPEPVAQACFITQNKGGERVSVEIPCTN